ALERLEPVRRLREAVGQDLLALDLGRLDIGGRIVRQEAPPHCLTKRCAQDTVTVQDRSWRQLALPFGSAAPDFVVGGRDQQRLKLRKDPNPKGLGAKLGGEPRLS